METFNEHSSNQPTSNSDAATKFYVDHKSTPQDLSPYIKKDGSVPMTGNLNMSGHKIINLEDPSLDKDAVNKKYINDQKLIHSCLLINQISELQKTLLEIFSSFQIYIDKE